MDNFRTPGLTIFVPCMLLECFCKCELEMPQKRCHSQKCVQVIPCLITPITPSKVNMTGWKNHHFEDVSRIKNADVPAIAMSVLRGSPCQFCGVVFCSTEVSRISWNLRPCQYRLSDGLTRWVLVRHEDLSFFAGVSRGAVQLAVVKGQG